MDKYYLITCAYRRKEYQGQWRYEYELTQDVFEFIKNVMEQYPHEEYKVIYQLEITAEQYAWMKDHL